MKSTFVVFTMLLCSGSALAQLSATVIAKQKVDSARLSQLSVAAIRYPGLRQGFIAKDIIGRGRMNSELYGKDLHTGEAHIFRTRINLNILVYQWGKNSLSATFNYLRQDFSFDNNRSLDSRFSVPDSNFGKTTLNMIASYSRRDTLFHLPVNFTVSVSGLTDGSFSQHRLNYLGLIVVPLKRTATTAVSVGAMMVIDPSSVVPAVPIVSYWHRFTKPGLELFVDLPSRVSLRKQLSEKAALSLGTDLGGNLSFFKFSNSYFPEQSVYTTLELKSGLNFEYRIQKKMILGISGGALTTANSRLLEKNAKNNDFFINNHFNTVPYATVTLSFLPFLRGLIQ